MSLGPTGDNRVFLMRKLKTRLRGTKFCTSSARFALRFVRQPNGPKCIQIVHYTPKHEFRVQWGGSVAFVAINSDATSCHELLHQFGPFRTEFCNATEWCQMHKKRIKHCETWVLGPMGWIACVRCQKFWCEFVARTVALIALVQPILHRVSCSNETIQNAPKHYENAPKHEFSVQWGGSRAFVAKNSDASSWHEQLH